MNSITLMNGFVFVFILIFFFEIRQLPRIVCKHVVNVSLLWVTVLIGDLLLLFIHFYLERNFYDRAIKLKINKRLKSICMLSKKSFVSFGRLNSETTHPIEMKISLLSLKIFSDYRELNYHVKDLLNVGFAASFL